MSKGSRIAIGITAVISAIGFLNSAMNPASVKAAPIVFYGLAVFCGVIAVACFSHKAPPATLRIIGGTVFTMYTFCAYSDFVVGKDIRVIIGTFALFGLPSGYLAIKGEYPEWGALAEVFNSAPKK
jgi:hypothetical protein